MPVNPGYEYIHAEQEYLKAQNIDDQIHWLEEMIKKAPKHKSSENFVAELKTRLKKFKERAEKVRKKKTGRKGIRKEGFQFVIVGFANSGKSSLLAKLTNATPKISAHGFSTTELEVGAFYFDGVQAQVVDMPPLESENFDVGIVNTADCVLIVVKSLEEIENTEKFLTKMHGKKIVVVNKIDLLDANEKRKLTERMRSKKISGVMISTLSGEGLDELKNTMLRSMGVLRIYLKEPGKVPKDKPLVVKDGATLRDVAEGIFKGFSRSVKETRLTGPSGKFPNQRVGLEHKVKDLDVVEFHTR